MKVNRVYTAEFVRPACLVEMHVRCRSHLEEISTGTVFFLKSTLVEPLPEEICIVASKEKSAEENIFVRGMASRK